MYLICIYAYGRGCEIFVQKIWRFSRKLEDFEIEFVQQADGESFHFYEKIGPQAICLLDQSVSPSVNVLSGTSDLFFT